MGNPTAKKNKSSVSADITANTTKVKTKSTTAASDEYTPKILPPKLKDKKVIISGRIPGELMERLEVTLKANKGFTISDVICLALEEFLKNK